MSRDDRASQKKPNKPIVSHVIRPAGLLTRCYSYSSTLIGAVIGGKSAMNPAWNILFGILVVASSAAAAYLINVSRERLWLRSKKSEDLYYKAEEAYGDLSNFFRDRYDLAQMTIYPRNGLEMPTIGRQVVDLRILVGLYFPALGANLSAVVAATGTAFDRLRLAEASDESNRERALHDLDFAVSNVKDAFDQFKNSILTAGRIDNIGKASDAVFNRARRVQSQRVFSLAA
jgi:hypothetical protein